MVATSIWQLFRTNYKFLKQNLKFDLNLFHDETSMWKTYCTKHKLSPSLANLTILPIFSCQRCRKQYVAITRNKFTRSKIINVRLNGRLIIILSSLESIYHITWDRRSSRAPRRRGKTRWDRTFSSLLFLSRSSIRRITCKFTREERNWSDASHADVRARFVSS